jgi:hypothetical protein
LISGGFLFIPRWPVSIALFLIGSFSFRFIRSKIDLRKCFIYLWIALVMILATFGQKEIDIATNFIRLGAFAIGLLLLHIYRASKFGNHLMDDLRIVLLPLAYLGVTTFALSAVAPGAFTQVEIGRQSMFTFMGVLNYQASLSDTVGLNRPIGFFWEPGVFAAFLNILLFVLFAQRAKLYHIIFTITAILLTSSTTGILVAALQMLFFIGKYSMERRKRARDMVVIAVALALTPTLYGIADANITEKLSGVFQGSFTARTFDVDTGLLVISENPLTGIGFSQAAYLEYSARPGAETSFLSEDDRGGRLSTNGVMVVLYSIGLPLGIFYLAGAYFQSLLPHRICFGTVVLALLASNPLSLTPFFIFLFFNGMIIGQQRARPLSRPS